MFNFLTLPMNFASLPRVGVVEAVAFLSGVFLPKGLERGGRFKSMEAVAEMMPTAVGGAGNCSINFAKGLSCQGLWTLAMSGAFRSLMPNNFVALMEVWATGGGGRRERLQDPWLSSTLLLLCWLNVLQAIYLPLPCQEYPFRTRQERQLHFCLASHSPSSSLESLH